MRRIMLVIAIICSGNAFATATSPGDYYVSANVLNVRLGPSTTASTTNTFVRKQRVKVYEIKGKWARVSKYYNGTFEGKIGRVARWVSAKYLSSSKPVDSFTNDTPLEKYISGSDNYSLYRDNFIKLSKKLIDQGRCTLDDYKEMHGWGRSVNYKPKPIYFTYCGGFSKGNKIYINAKNGKNI